MSQPIQGVTLRAIALEEHYATPSFFDGTPGRQLAAQVEAAKDHPEVAQGQAQLSARLSDLGEGRIAALDAAGIAMQVLSLTAPGVEQLDAPEALALARDANDQLAAAIERYPLRFAGFAAVPTIVPATAADELERMVSGHGFKGACINGHTRGRYLDDPFFWPILERAEALDVPIYLHPTPPRADVVTALYQGNYAAGVTGGLATAAWGWHIETATHVLRLILSGALDRYPRLQLIIGHMGEALPFMIHRLDVGLPPRFTKLARPVSAYLRENVCYTFGGFNYTPTFLNLLLEVGVERIMFSTDYPYGSLEAARAFLDDLPVSPVDKARIAHGNAERVLRLQR